MASEFGRLSATLYGETTRFEVRPAQAITLGRSPECTVRLRDTKVSREHCRLSLRDGRVFVTDLDSTHGLVHQGRRSAEFELEVGDGFHVGETYVRYEARHVDNSVPAAVDAVAPAPGAAAASDASPALPPGPQGLHAEERSAPSLPGNSAAAQPPLAGTAAAEPTPETPAARAEPVLERVWSSRSRGRAPVSAGTAFLARLTGQAVVFSIHVVVVVAMLLVLKLAAGVDVYRLLDWLGVARR